VHAGSSLALPIVWRRHLDEILLCVGRASEGSSTLFDCGTVDSRERLLGACFEVPAANIAQGAPKAAPNAGRQGVLEP
jgi:hypothetical protein